MTHEEIKGAIERLRDVVADGCKMDTFEVMRMAFGGGTTWDYCYVLIDLLRQADPETHMELPNDADGVPIHIGDELISNHSKKRFVATRLKYSRKHAWMVGGADKDDLSEYGLYAPCEIRHYHKPTVEDVLREFVNEWIDADSENDVFAEYADRLRKVIADED